MATALRAVPRNNEPVSVAAAFYSLSVLRDTVKDAFPQANEVSITLEASGALRLSILTQSLVDPSEIVFSLNKHLVPGYRFAKVNQTRDRSTGRHLITALVEMN
jgi:hypothetical protein